jgi:hypothetical protein
MGRNTPSIFSQRVSRDRHEGLPNSPAPADTLPPRTSLQDSVSPVPAGLVAFPLMLVLDGDQFHDRAVTAARHDEPDEPRRGESAEPSLGLIPG